MQITEIDTFLNYYEKVKDRTRHLFKLIPQDKMEWSYSPDKFTFGDIIRHLATIERNMYAENVKQRTSRYNGCGIELANGYDEVIKFYNDMHDESVAIFKSLSATDLESKCETPAGFKITIWKWLRAMVEHEIHHRGQLYTYLALLEIKVPPLYGLTSEQVIEKGNFK